MIDQRFEIAQKKVNLETPWKKSAKFVKYDETFPQILFDELTNQKTIAQAAKRIGVSKATLLRWCEEIEDMQEAYELGMTNFEADVEENVIQKYMIHDDEMVDPPVINTKLVDMYLKSNLKKFADLDQKQGTTVNVNNINSSEADLSSKLANAMEDFMRLKNQGDVPMKDITPEPEKLENE